MTKAFGIDVARTDGQVNWEVAAGNNVIFAAARASISWGYRDGWIPANWVGMKRVGIHRLAYHVLFPGENFQAQAENFLAAVGIDLDHAVPVLDIELDHGVKKEAITECMLNWCDFVEKRWMKPVIYSRAAWINEFTVPGTWRSKFKWWLAAFLNDKTIERTYPPDLPVGVTSWLIHQTADKVKPFPGLMQSLELDTNRWNGTEDDVHAFFGLPLQNTLTTEQKVSTLWGWALEHGMPKP